MKTTKVYPLSRAANPLIDRDSGSAKNWIQTTRGKGWFALVRFYGPLEPFFDQSWKPDDIVEVK